MFWIVVGFAIIAVVWLVARKLTSKLLYSNDDEFRNFVESLKMRVKGLSDHDRNEMIDEARRLAFAGYDRLVVGAQAAGKSESFAHQAGVLDAAYCVLANDNTMRKDRRVERILQRETLPFNAVGQHDGKLAITEYLIWKIFPDQADLTKVMPAIDDFVKKVIEDSKSESDPTRSLELFLRSEQFDWQKLAANSQEMRFLNG